MSRLLYFLTTFAESGLSVFGIRTPYEQPAYAVVRTLGDGVELRHYAPRVAVECQIADGRDGEAFGRLFRYITGANTEGVKVAMTAPVEQTGRTIAMTVPVEMGGPAGAHIMRFFLPKEAAASPPAPTDAKLRIVHLPAATFGVIRFSGTITEAVRQEQARRLLAALGQAGLATSGPVSLLSYDPPFALPFLRRNEMAQLVDLP